MRAWTVVVALALSGCAADSVVREQVAAEGDKPVAYKAGFADGCKSAYLRRSLNHSNEQMRDEARMLADPQYALAWNDGWRKCDMGPGVTPIMTF